VNSERAGTRIHSAAASSAGPGGNPSRSAKRWSGHAARAERPGSSSARSTSVQAAGGGCGTG